MLPIKYKKGYKYQLVEIFEVKLPLSPAEAIDDGLFLTLSTFGVLSIKAGYAWDGPSGPTLDTANFMRGSLVHDALYQLMRNGHLDRGEYRDIADRLLQRQCKEDGMSSPRAWWVYWGVRLFGGKASHEDAVKNVLSAPR
ncbi:DUF1353 domain-containing protein [Corallincola luteus]|uniref:DUF1353 domain-containing protein n=1 Tax=Corallincola luteus TaxID=1775177 RepID=UPI00196AA453|nr:DUF1353 domain-containing protein [Corallincola luteus]